MMVIELLVVIYTASFADVKTLPLVVFSPHNSPGGTPFCAIIDPAKSLSFPHRITVDTL